jgi:hypothetical protein
MTTGNVIGSDPHENLKLSSLYNSTFPQLLQSNRKDRSSYHQIATEMMQTLHFFYIRWTIYVPHCVRISM